MPYTCHNCGTTLETYPFPENDPVYPPEALPKIPIRQIHCPGCWNAGYREDDEMNYFVDISSGTAQLVE